MKLAVAQLAVTETLDHNLQKIIRFLGLSAIDGVDLVCFPEMCLTGYTRRILSDADLNTLVGGALARIEEEVRSLRVGAIIGHPWKNGETLLNRATVILPDGQRFTYDKIYPTEAETKYFVSGKDHLAFSLGDLKCGVIICRDQNYPSLARDLKGHGAKVLFILADHLYQPKEARWKLEKNRALPIARAVENGMYVLLANTVGSRIGMVSLGNSLIVDPDGAVVVSASESEETLISFSIKNLRRPL